MSSCRSPGGPRRRRGGRWGSRARPSSSAWASSIRRRVAIGPSGPSPGQPPPAGGAAVAAVGGLPQQAAEADIVFDDDEELRQVMKEAVSGDAPSRAIAAASDRTGDQEKGDRTDVVSGTLTDWDPEFRPPAIRGGR